MNDIFNDRSVSNPTPVVPARTVTAPAPANVAPPPVTGAAASAMPDPASEPSPAAPPPAPAAPPANPKPPAGKRSARGCLLIGGLAVAGLFLIGLLVVALLVWLFTEGGSWSGTARPVTFREELVIGDPWTNEKLAVIDVKGLITGGSFYDGASATVICEALRAVREDSSVRGVILDMDTPGGEVTASDEIHHAIQTVRAAGKPVVTCMHALGASGGYFIAAGTDHIIANRLTLTGSVGVIMGTLNYAKLFDKLGLEAETYKSGEMKDMLSGGRERTAAEVFYVNQMVRETFLEFATIVARGRSTFANRFENVLKEPFADGRVLSGNEAFRLGLVDELGYFDDAVRKARVLGRAPDAKVVRFRKTMSITDILFAVETAARLKTLGPVPADWARIKPGQPYYLLPGYMP
jgi:protease-4